MFKRKTKPLTLRIGDQEYNFPSAKELEFALAGRVALPSSRISTLMDSSLPALQKEAEGIKQVERRFADAVTRSIEDDNVIGEFFKDLDLAIISQDNDWRPIINALYGLDSSSNEYRRVGLVNYTQYLVARHELVQTLYRARQAPGPPATVRDTRDAQAFKETMLFELTTFSPASKKREDFGRLPKGETVDISLLPNQSLTLLLARHRFNIVASDRLHFVDDNGKDIELRRGKNVIGRDLSSDVVVDAEYRDVSRKHLIVEAASSDLIRLTDVSSLGTSVPNEYLDATSP